MPGSSPPTRSRPRTARERVAQRRGVAPAQRSTPTRSRSALRPRPRGCANPALLIGGGAVLLVALLLLYLAGRALGTLQTIQQDDPRRAEAALPGDQAVAEGELSTADLATPFTVLLLGVDLREDPDEGARSDTLIVVRVDPQGRWASMLSIPRDSIADIPRSGGMRAKINYAYTYGYQNAAALYGPNAAPAEGGGALAAEAVEGFLGIPIDYIAQVDFRGFEQIVDTLGGVTVDVPRPLLDAEYPNETYGVERLYIPAGLQRMGGATALRYARSRHADSDFGRSKRQQQVLRALLDEIRRKGLLEQASALPGLAQALERTVSTTLPVSDPQMLGGLANLARELSADRVLQLTINQDEVALLAEDGSDLYWDEAGVQSQVARLLAGPAPQASAAPARIQVQNGAGIEGVAGRVSSYLSGQGFQLDAAVDADTTYERSLILDYSDRPETRQRLAEVLGIAAEQIRVGAASGAAGPPPGTDIVVVIGADFDEARLAGN
jgi:polyisoprenyl-teichoic acid--peptidoglycan teichoic acid transferase